jgi:TPR repeat protein
MAAGAGTKKNIPQAWAWANIAIQNGDKDAKTILGEISTIASTKDIEDGKKALEELRAELAKLADPNAAAPAPDADPTKPSPDEKEKKPDGKKPDVKKAEEKKPDDKPPVSDAKKVEAP